jgi:hypothetical protein
MSWVIEDRSCHRPSVVEPSGTSAPGAPQRASLIV